MVGIPSANMSSPRPDLVEMAQFEPAVLESCLDIDIDVDVELQAHAHDEPASKKQRVKDHFDHQAELDEMLEWEQRFTDCMRSWMPADTAEANMRSWAQYNFIVIEAYAGLGTGGYGTSRAFDHLQKMFTFCHKCCALFTLGM